MTLVSPRGSFFTRGESYSLWIRKGSPLAIDSVARVVAATMPWAVVRLWDRMWLEVQVQELLW